jgi:hypothetical protein
VDAHAVARCQSGAGDRRILSHSGGIIRRCRLLSGFGERECADGRGLDQRHVELGIPPMDVVFEGIFSMRSPCEIFASAVRRKESTWSCHTSASFALEGVS